MGQLSIRVPVMLLHHLSLSTVPFGLMYMVLYWALPTPYTPLERKLTYLVSNCESQRLSCQVSEPAFSCKRSEWRFSFCLNEHIGPPASVHF